MIRQIALLLMIVLMIPSTILANPGNNPTNPNADPSQPVTDNGGETCDLTQYKDSLFGTESASSGDHKAVHCGRVHAYGRYQFLEGTLKEQSAFRSAPAGCKGLDDIKRVGKNLCHGQSGFPTAGCAGTQEAVMDEFTLKNLKYLKEECPAAVNAVNTGKIVTGYKTSKGGVGSKGCKGLKRCTCKVTWSGVLAGGHIGGKKGICNTLGTGKDVDDGYTSRLFYVCEHGGLQVPGTDCTPQSYQTDQGSQPAGDLNSPGSDGPAGPIADREILEDPNSSFNVLEQTLKAIWVAGFQLMTNHLTTTMMQQVETIGTFFDVKHQLETQRLMQQKFAQAHKDYHPSEQMCEIGTFVRNLAESEKRADLTQTAMSRAMLDRTLMTGDVKTMTTGTDDNTRLKAYIDKFCNIADNAKQNEKLCKDSGEPEQQGADINFTQTIDAPLTLEIDIHDKAQDTTKEEENIFAFLDYIFTHDSFPWVSSNKTPFFAFVEPYQDMRAIVAMRNVAQNSFSHIISQKTQSTEDPEESVAPFLKSLMREMGLEDKNIEETIGKNPSYFAQMEILTKKIYQHPEFISNLYDKPANVKRLRATMTAIKLMQDRDIHKALMRREMLISMILELKLRNKQNELINQDINSVLTNPPGIPQESGGGNASGGGASSGQVGADTF